jgi:putative tricarboxylic transport membrane protein
MIWDSILQALTPYILLITLSGVSLGIVWGAMPGLSTTMAMALLIGLSAGMDQNTALSFMLGVYTGSVFGGAISAVMINIPGTPDAVPTMIEGHQLARRGEGGQALGMAIGASFIGNWVGISIHGVPRFTFGILELQDGINYVAVLIGLFGLAEVLRVLPQRDHYTIPAEVGRVVPSFRMLARYSRAAVRSGIIGTLIGAIPGAGANVASFLAYDIGRRRAKPEEKAKWGKGSYEAIVSAEVANNANIGGSMLPMLALGIPGNAAAAALLAALTLKNVVVGPTIEIDHPGLIYFIYTALVVANILMYGAAIMLIKPCVKLFSLPRGLLLPLIIPICVIGSYAIRLNMFDVWVMFASGLVGYVLHAFRFPTAPIVLGVILAPLADENFRRALLIFEDKSIGYVLSQYVGTFLLFVMAFIFIEGIMRVRRERRNRQEV